MQLNNAVRRLCLEMGESLEKTFTIQKQLNSRAIGDTYLLLKIRSGNAVKMKNGKIMREERRNFRRVNVSFQVAYHV